MPDYSHRMGHYISNVRDVEFNLFEALNIDKALATGEFGDLDGESVREMLSEAARLAEGPVAEAFAETDRNPPTFDPSTHTVSYPEPFKAALRRVYRDRIRAGAGGAVTFVHLAGSREVIAGRMAARTGHYMPPSLLDSQFATLEAPGPDEAVTVDIALPLAEVVATVLARLG